MTVPQHRPIAVTAVLTALLLAGCGTSTDESIENGTTESSGTAIQGATLAEEVETEGGRATSGDWEVAYTVEPAEAWFETIGVDPTRHEPAEGRPFS